MYLWIVYTAMKWSKIDTQLISSDPGEPFITWFLSCLSLHILHLRHAKIFILLQNFVCLMTVFYMMFWATDSFSVYSTVQLGYLLSRSTLTGTEQTSWFLPVPSLFVPPSFPYYRLAALSPWLPICLISHSTHSTRWLYLQTASWTDHSLLPVTLGKPSLYLSYATEKAQRRWRGLVPHSQESRL